MVEITKTLEEMGYNTPIVDTIDELLSNAVESISITEGASVNGVSVINDDNDQLFTVLVYSDKGDKEVAGNNSLVIILDENDLEESENSMVELIEIDSLIDDAKEASDSFMAFIDLIKARDDFSISGKMFTIIKGVEDGEHMVKMIPSDVLKIQIKDDRSKEI